MAFFRTQTSSVFRTVIRANRFRAIFSRESGRTNPDRTIFAAPIFIANATDFCIAFSFGGISYLGGYLCPMSKHKQTYVNSFLHHLTMIH